MSNSAGFTLVEALVGALIGLVLVLTVGNLGARLVHQRTSNASNSAATSLAEQQLERLLALPSPTTQSSLAAGTHGPCGSPPCLVDLTGASTATGPYKIQWVVVNSSTSSSSPIVEPSGISSLVKKITVTVTHYANLSVNASVVTYYKVS